MMRRSGLLIEECSDDAGYVGSNDGLKKMKNPRKMFGIRELRIKYGLMKRCIAFVIAFFVAFSKIFIIAPEKIVEAAGVSHTISFDNSLIEGVGGQTHKTNSCGCFAMAYTRSILDKEVHNWWEYNYYGTKDETNCSASWSKGGYDYVYIGDINFFWRIAYESIRRDIPCIIRVKGNGSDPDSGHYVTLVGYQNITDLSSLNESNFEMIDSVSPEIRVYDLDDSYYGGSYYPFVNGGGDHEILLSNWFNKNIYEPGLIPDKIVDQEDPLEGYSVAPLYDGDQFYAAIVNINTGKYLTATSQQGTAEGTHVIEAHDKDNSDNQIWSFRRNSDGSFNIKSTYDWLCMDVLNYEDSNGNVVQTCVANGSTAQKWNLYSGNGGYFLRAECCTNTVVDLDKYTNQLVHLWEVTKGDTQNFSLKRYYRVDFTDGDNIFRAYAEAGKSAITVPNWTKEGYRLSWDTDFSVVNDNLTVNAVWTPVNKVPVEGGYYKLMCPVPNSGLFLDVGSNLTENGTNIHLYSSVRHGGQTFYIDENWNKSGYYIQHSHSGKFVTTENFAAGTNNVFLWEGNGDDGQQWIFEDAGDGYVYVRNLFGYYLDVDGTFEILRNVRVAPFEGTSAQKWKLVKVSGQDFKTIDEGYYKMQCSSADKDLFLDIKDNLSENGTNIRLNSPLATKDQILYIGENSNRSGFYLRHYSSGKYVSTEDETAGSKNAYLWEGDGSDGQQWLLEEAGGGYYYVRNLFGYYLEVSGGVFEADQNIAVNSFTGQSLHIVKCFLQ